MKINFDVLYALPGLMLIDTIMHSGDVFEPGKKCAQYAEAEVEVEDEAQHIARIGNTLVNHLADQFKRQGGYAVFIGTKTPGMPAYIMPGVQSLSIHEGGQLRWGLFRDILQMLGYVPEVDENMRVTGIAEKQFEDNTE